MANLTPEDAAQLGYGPNFASSAEGEIRKDPFAAWWAMLTGDKNTTLGNMASSQGVGIDPIRSGNEAASLVESLGIPGQVAGTAQMDPRLRAGANAAPGANPYSAIVANQVRPAQVALYDQMRAQQAGPSVAAMQGARAQGQNLQAALGAGGGHGIMMQAGQVGAGLAGDTGAGRLAEQLRGSQGLDSMVGGVRGADLGVAGAQAQAGLQQRGLDDAMRQFYAQQGSRLSNTNADLAAEREKLLQLGKVKRDARDLEAGKNFAGSAASTLSMGLGK